MEEIAKEFQIDLEMRFSKEEGREKYHIYFQKFKLQATTYIDEK